MVLTEEHIAEKYKPRLPEVTNRNLQQVFNNWEGSEEQKKAKEFREGLGCTCITDIKFAFEKYLKEKESKK